MTSCDLVKNSSKDLNLLKKFLHVNMSDINSLTKKNIQELVYCLKLKKLLTDFSIKTTYLATIYCILGHLDPNLLQNFST